MSAGVLVVVGGGFVGVLVVVGEGFVGVWGAAGGGSQSFVACWGCARRGGLGKEVPGRNCWGSRWGSRGRVASVLLLRGCMKVAVAVVVVAGRQRRRWAMASGCAGAEEDLEAAVRNLAARTAAQLRRQSTDYSTNPAGSPPPPPPYHLSHPHQQPQLPPP